MAPDRVDLRPTIDRTWLEAAAAADPVAHAYALWDLDRFPHRIRFVSAVRGDAMLGYLLVWQPTAARPFVHWVGPALEELAHALPPRPLVVLGPEAVAPLVLRTRGPATTFRVLVETAPLGTRPVAGAMDAQVRRLTRKDTSALESLARSASEAVAQGYAGLDPEAELVFGGFDGTELVGAARAVIRQPRVWLVSGVYVHPSHRGRGWGRALTRAVMVEGERAGAPSALFVREDRVAARAVYEHLGFHPVGERVWVDCGANLPP
jgi:GNAT superfamily N-acetyltransferase